MMLKKYLKNENGFTIIEIIVTLVISGIFASISIPSGINWIKQEKLTAYTRELKEYIRLARRESRRWGRSCEFKILDIPYTEEGYGFNVKCFDEEGNKKDQDMNLSIDSLRPSISKELFQIVSNNFKTTPNGELSGSNNILILIGLKKGKNSPQIIKCLKIITPTGMIKEGTYIKKKIKVTKKMPTSQIKEYPYIKGENCQI